MQHYRKEYQKMQLNREDMLSSPMEQFRQWFKDAEAGDIPEPNVMVLSTADASGRVRSRIVLLKEITEQGFIFYSNYTSRKAQDMEENSSVALLFHWENMERQVRIEGQVSKCSSEKSDAYFKSRPRGSQMGAWTSPQSSVIEDRSTLDEKYAELQERFQSQEDLPRPDFWGGYEVIPDTIEFWQGRKNRLHDRFIYSRKGSSWDMHRLAP